jgi:plasmid stabilization system protein ParE
LSEYRIEISAPAEDDLRNIVRYISAQLSAPMTALKMMETIEKAVSELAYMPKSYPPVLDEHLSAAGYRKLIVKNHIVFFTINEEKKVVDIIRILYARRDWRHIL